MIEHPNPPFPPQSQELPGSFIPMQPRPDHGETSWRGVGRLPGPESFQKRHVGA